MKAMGAPYKGVLYAGLMITRRRAEADRIQCPLRRSGMPGADAAADVGPGARAAREPRRHAQDRSICAGIQKPPSPWSWRPKAIRALMAGLGDRGARRGAGRRGRGNFPRRHQGRGRPHPRQWRTRAQCLRRSATPCGRRKRAPMQAIARSAGRKASAGTTSAGAPSNAHCPLPNTDLR